MYVLKFSIQLSLAHKSRRGFYGSQCSYFVYCGCFKYLWACSVTESVTGTTRTISIGIYLHKVNNRNNRTRCEVCSKLIIKTPERRHWRRSGVFIVNFEHISYHVRVFLLLTLNMLLPAGM